MEDRQETRNDAGNEALLELEADFKPLLTCEEFFQRQGPTADYRAYLQREALDRLPRVLNTFIKTQKKFYADLLAAQDKAMDSIDDLNLGVGLLIDELAAARREKREARERKALGLRG